MRGGFWLYASTVVSNLLGLAYWMAISAVGGAEVLGITSTVVGLATVINGALGLGTATGVQRFLGMWANDREQKAKYFYTTLAFTAAVHASAAAALFVMGLAGTSLGELTPQMLTAAGVLVALGFTSTYAALMTAQLKTDVYFAAVAAGNLAKLAVGVALVKAGWGWTGAALGYALVGAAVLAAGAYYAPRWTGRPTLSLSALADVLKAGVASWAPGIIATLGQWLGVLAIFHAATAAETGQYYAALTIANVVLMTATSILSLLLPVLSGMADGRKRAAACSLAVVELEEDTVSVSSSPLPHRLYLF